MSRMLGLFKPARPVSVALPGGQAPVSWQRDLGRSTARLEALWQACAWVETLAAVRPRLRDEPLLGRCLAELTNRVSRPTELRPETDQTRRSRPTWAERPLKRDPGTTPKGKPLSAPSRFGIPQGSVVTTKQASQAPRKQLSRRRTLPPLQLEPQVSRTLLGRLASEAGSAEGSSRPRRRQIKGLPQPKRRVLSPASLDQATQRDWLRDLAQRAERSLRQDGLDQRRTSWRRALLEQKQLGQAQSLLDQWALPLKGQPASADLLARLAGTLVGDSNGSGREVQPPAAPSRPPGARPPDQPVAPATKAAQPQAASHQPSGSRSLDQSFTPAAGEAQPWPMVGPTLTEDTPSGVLPTEVSHKGSGGGELGSPARIAPPAVAPSLPPLLLPQTVSEPPLTVGTATVRQEARQEAVAVAEKDLSVLATKIKRILDEEARRYGIDV